MIFVGCFKAGLHARTRNYTYGLRDEPELDGRAESRLQFYCHTYKTLAATAGLAISFELQVEAGLNINLRIAIKLDNN